MAIQALEEAVAAVPAYCASTAVGRYETAILGGCGSRRRGLRRRTAEPAHGEFVLCGERVVECDDSLVDFWLAVLVIAGG